jgi:D-inositol-3-phosphate glycosyltransferase
MNAGRLRLAWITPTYQVNAGDAWSPGLTALAHRLAAEHEVVVYALRSRGGRERFRIGQVEVHAFAAGPPRDMPVVRRLAPLARAVAALLARPRDQRPDVVHALWANEPAAAGALAAPALHRPLLLSSMGGEPADLPGIGFGGARTRTGRLLLRVGARAAHTLTAGSRWHADVLRARTGGIRPIAVMPLGVDLARFGGAPGRPPRPLDQPPRVLAVGSLLPVKGHRLLIESLPLLLPRLPPELRGLRVRIVGDGPERAVLAALIERLQLRAHVELAGPLSHDAMPAAYAAADLFVLSSHYESQCLALVEALAGGLPAASTPVGLAPELLGDGRAGELAAAVSPEALAAALHRLLLRRREGPELEREARAAALPFALERTTDRWIQLYRQVAAAAAAR